MTQKIFKHGIVFLLCMIASVMTFAQNRNTTSELNIIDTNKTATEGILYLIRI